MELSATESGTVTKYRMRMNHIEACNCQHGCNCQFGGCPNEGKCDCLLGYNITERRYGEVDLGGVKVVVALKYPNAIHEGNGEGVFFVDEDASQEQADTIDEIWKGRAGGMPWDALAGTLVSFDGPVRMPIELTVDGKRSEFRIPGVLELRMTLLLDPVTGEEKDVQIRYPKGGFFGDEADCTTSGTMEIDYEQMQLSSPGEFASVAIAEWSNET